MNAVIFGGSGFLGSHVADALTETGHKVIIFDLRHSPYLHSDQKMVIGDILDMDKVFSAVEACDVIYNFAGIADIDECAGKPIETVKYNILGNSIILEAARKAKTRRFVFASSVYVYSNTGAFYRSSKQACESFIEDYNKLYGLPYTVLRFGSLYGERADERNSIYKLIKNALLTGKIVYHGTGDEQREYIHVKDAAALSVKILEPEFKNQHVILTGNLAMEYRDLLEMIREMLGNRVEIVYKEKERDAHYKVTPYAFNPKLGRKLVNNPHIDMGQGLLNCMKEIYEQIHQEKHEEMGWLIHKGGEFENDRINKTYF
ncbi:NAD(P)-dependent oxidoreductase [bacterium]|nr:NAD(P)-dependent oxidoreductase [bacterium]MBU1616030.1 NAD(P)-dependent oxidoreductase [bacterium]